MIASLIALSVGWSAGAEAQELQTSHPLASEGSIARGSKAQGNDLLGPYLKQIVASETYKFDGMPQGGTGAPPSAHAARNDALGGLALIGLGGLFLGLSGSQSCLKSNTCTAYKVVGAGFLFAGGLGLAVAADESGKQNSQIARKAKKAKTSGASATSNSPVYFPSSTAAPAANAGDIASAQNAINQIESEPHTQAPPVQAIGSNYGGSTSIIIQNSTPDMLTVYLAGPSGLTVTVFSQGSQTVQVIPGSYRIGGRVSDSSVLPFLGYASFTSGSRYQETFYISTVPQ